MERLEGTIKVSELFEYMRENGYVIVQSTPVKEKILKKKWITLKEIADSKIWGVDKGAVKIIVKKEVDPDCIDTRSRKHKIHRSEVERIALNRNTI